jgi:branched-chain amino acid transport system permease protein
LPFIVALILATLVTGLVGWLLGRLILDLDPQSVLVATLSFATIIQYLVTTEKWLTKGVVGLGSVPFPFDFGRYSDLGHLALMLIITAGLIWYAYRLEAAPYGRLLTSIQDNEVLARGLGKFTFQEKLRFFTVTSAVIGLLGALNASAVHFLVPRMLGPGVTFTVWIALILGGRKRVLGGMIGVLATVGIFDFVLETFVPISPQSAQLIPVIKNFLYGTALVLILLFRPYGILGAKRVRRSA